METHPMATTTHTTVAPRILEYYAAPGLMTDAGLHTSLFDDLPRDVQALARVAPGLIIHEYISGAYGVKTPESRKNEKHVRPVSQILNRILELDNRGLTEHRDPDHRFVGICRHFEVLFVAMLRAQGTPARIRRGFGAYFSKDFEDHEISEVWNADESRWMRIDSQLDEVQRRVLGVQFDPMEVPVDQFLTATDAWTRCRAGELDPDRFGIFDMRGYWFIAGCLIRDVAWLAKQELLPWDVWGGIPKPGARLGTQDMEFFDRLAALTRDPDASFDELQTLASSDDRVRVPSKVFNAMTNREESI
jgi:transglutaminase-like putative cysteine protease